MKHSITRRYFLKTAAAAGAVGAWQFIPARALGKARLVAPSNRITLGVLARLQAPTPAGLSPGTVTVAQPAVESPRPRMTPLSPERVGIEITVDRVTYDKLQRARDLLGHRTAESTSVYLRLATDDLRRVALPLPRRRTRETQP